MSVNFLQNTEDKNGRRATIAIALGFTLLVGILASVGASASYKAATRGTSVLTAVGSLPVIGDLRKLVFGNDVNADGGNTPDNRINVMLFGVGGAGHDGPQLTDTIEFASIDTQNSRVGLLSIPRDLAFPLGGARFEKINAVNAYAEQDNPGQGAIIAAKAIGKLLGVRVDHVVKIDFSGFEKFVDILGGIDVNVERSFVDYSYPTDANGTTTISFKAGLQHMNGGQALAFSRSRHGTNGENSDFARSKRQQIVLEAVREKLLALGTLTNPQKIAELWSAVSSHIQTDLSAWDMIKLAPFAARFDKKNLTSHVLTSDPGGELIATDLQDTGYTLFPKKPDWSEIRALAQDPFETSEQIDAQNHAATPANIEIKNGTTHTGFASQASVLLKREGYTVTAVGNANDRAYERTVIFDLTTGKKSQDLARLAKLLDATVSSAAPLQNPNGQRTVYSDSMVAEPISSSSSDFLVILGSSSLGLIEPYASQTTP